MVVSRPRTRLTRSWDWKIWTMSWVCSGRFTNVPGTQHTQLRVRTGEPPLDKSFLPVGELRSCCSHSYSWKFSLRSCVQTPLSQLPSRIPQLDLTHRPLLRGVSQQWHGAWQKKCEHKGMLRLSTFLKLLQEGRQKQNYRPWSTIFWSCRVHEGMKTTPTLLRHCMH